MKPLQLHPLLSTVAVLLALSGCASQPTAPAPAEGVAVSSAITTDAPAQAVASEEPAAQTSQAAGIPAPSMDATGTLAASNSPVATSGAQKVPAGDASAAQVAGAPAPEDVDIDAIYGNAVQGETPHDTAPRAAIDPWERYNRRVHAINNALDRRIIRPVAVGYVRVVPTPVRDSVANFFRNLSGPVHTVNAALQGKFDQAGGSLFRFLVNSTFGVAGLFDVATRMHIPDKGEDFGQTLAKWGWKRSRYLELPLFGPRTVRDIVGFGVDSQLNPWQGARSASGQVALQTMQVVNVRAQLLSTDTMRENAHDDYSLFRDAWWQRRNYQIWGEEREAQAGTLVPGAGSTPNPK